MTTIYGIKTCDTVKKAIRWLDNNAITYRFHDLRQDGIEQTDLQQWIDSVGWEVLLNKSSTTWRQLGERDKSDIDARKAQSLMLDNPTLIKRPVLVHGNTVLVGFKETVYQKALG